MAGGTANIGGETRASDWRSTRMDMSRRQFFRVCGASLAGSSIAALGFSPGQALAEVREFKLARTTETRNTCPYCSVSCGVILYSLGDKSKNAKSEIIHIEGDPDNPVNRGTLCPKGAGLLDLVHSPNRLKYPEVREPGSNEWKRISWDDALTRIAKHIKADRDANFVEKNAAGQIVNRWPTVGLVGSSAVSNEVGYLTVKVARGLGLVSVETQARI
jgi:formate dehydrogenase major subunit